MSKMVQVKQCDIVRGECGDNKKCALARALNRTFKQKGWGIRGAYDISSPYNRKYRVVNNDYDKVSNFIDKFDDKLKVRPIKFSIIAND